MYTKTFGLQSFIQHSRNMATLLFSILEDGLIVGHIKELSRTCWHFIARDGKITCKITGQRQRSVLLRGILEISCIYTFIGKSSSIIDYEQIEPERSESKQAKEKSQ